MDRITIGTLWDGRTERFPLEYVNRLYWACERHCKRPFDFVLMAGPLVYERGLEKALQRQIRAVPSGLPYWWGGIRFWMKDPPGVGTEMILHLDLDVVIVGDLEPLFEFAPNTYMKDWPRATCPAGCERDINVSVSWIRRGGSARAWEIYEAAGMPQWDPMGKAASKPIRYAVQGIINEQTHGFEHNQFPEELVSSYKLHARDHGIPPGCRVVVFHGRPKQHEVDEPWVREHWR